MALFKTRKGGDDAPSTSSQPESVEAMRRRARHRLIGAVVLVLAGVIGFPLLFDTQPRPIAVDIPIDIPDRNKARPPAPPPVVSGPVSGAVSSPDLPATTVSEPKVPVAGVPRTSPAIETIVPAEPVAEAKPEAKPEPKVAKVEPRAETRPETRPSANSAEAAKAKALLEGKPVDTAAAAPAAAAVPAAEGRFVVQVGAFADPAKARETRLKVEKAGLKTYTHVAETKDGARTRVRVGPFATRADADRAAEKIKGLDLPAAILTL